MNKGTKIRTALAIAISLYVAFYKVDVTEFGNDIVTLIYQIAAKIVTFVVIFLVTYYNQDFSEEACKGTGLTRYLKEMKKQGYIGDVIINTPEIVDDDDIEDENDHIEEEGEDDE